MAHAQRTSPIVIGGIDTHKDLHAAAVVDRRGTVLATELFSTTRAGYRALLRWMRSFGDVRQVGVEGTGSYGASVARHLLDAGRNLSTTLRHLSSRFSEQCLLSSM